MECVDKPEVGQIWISKKSDNPFAPHSEVTINQIKEGYISYNYIKGGSEWSKSKRHFCDIFELQKPKKSEEAPLTWSGSNDSDLILDSSGVAVSLVDDQSGTWTITDVTDDWGTVTTSNTDAYITINPANMVVSSSFNLTLPKSENKSCIGGELWYNGSDLMTCKNGKAVKLLTESSQTEVHYFHTTEKKGNDMFTFGNLCILIVLMFVVAKLANRVNWYVFLYPVKKFFGFTKRTAKKVKEELNEAKIEWNKIEE